VRGEGHEPDRRCGTFGTSGHATTKSSIHNGAYFINPASMHRRYDSLPREICGVSWRGLRGEQSSLTAPQKSAEGIVGMRERAEGLNGGRESWPEVER
jgi:hypothetical protein